MASNEKLKIGMSYDFWLNCGHCPQAVLEPGPLSLLGIFMNLPHAVAEPKHTALLCLSQ